MSGEHIFANWISRVIDAGPRRTQVIRSHETSEGAKTQTFTGEPLQQTIKRVCKICNEGWMAELESEAKPVMKPMLLDEQPVVLDALEQELLARWAIKTALVMSKAMINPGPGFPPTVEQYHWFYEHRRPLPGSVVWIGRSDGRENWPAYVDLKVIEFKRELPDGTEELRRDTLSVAIAIAHLVFIVVVAELDSQPIFGGGPGNKRVHVWPTGGLPARWPPPQSFGSSAELRETTLQMPGGPVPHVFGRDDPHPATSR